jgi:putative ATP-dependent endonuclease of the OLD family
VKIHSVGIKNFRGIQSANLVLPGHAVLIGDNNTGKSSVLEAIDLVPDRLSRRPPVDEHDFYQGKYLAAPAVAGEPVAVVAGGGVEDPPRIIIDVTVSDLSEEQQARFGDNIEWLKTSTGAFYNEAACRIPQSCG